MADPYERQHPRAPQGSADALVVAILFVVVPLIVAVAALIG